MSDIRITGLNNNIQGLRETNTSKNKSVSFGDIMQDAIEKINQIQNEADNAVKELASGGDMTQAIIAMEKADMSFQLMVEVRNKLLNAYEEIQRMQV